MKDIKDIKSGTGLGILTFGMSREQVEKILGEPNEKEAGSYTDSDEDLMEAWHYDDLDLSISFDQEEDWRLVAFSVSSEDYLLKGKNLIGLNQEDLLSALDALKISDCETEDLSLEENSSHKLISSDSLSINFWLDNEVLTEIQWTE